MKFLKDLKTWKTIIQFIITVLTAIISSFFVQSCRSSIHSTEAVNTLEQPVATTTIDTLPADRMKC